MKVLVLAIASRGSPYDEFAKIWKMYMNSRPWIKSYLVYGDSNEFKIEEDEIHVPVQECLIPGILHKTIWTMRWSKDVEYDWLLRTNLSSFWLLDRMYEFLQKIPKENIMISNYEFPIWEKATGILNGSGMFFSRDVVERLAALENFDYSAPDDRELTYKGLDVGARILHKPFYFWLSDTSDIEATENIKCLNEGNCFQVRIRNPYHGDGYKDVDKRLSIDLPIQRILYFYYYCIL